MFVDRAKIVIKAGDGGNGCVSFRREKHVPRGGPDGGDGGRGGHIILKVDSNLQTLYDFHYRSHFKAQRGRHGSGARKTGQSGADLTIRVPAGTVIFDFETRAQLADLIHNDQEFIAARGGRGGKGNASFATSTQRAPRISQPGEKGEAKTLLLELKLIADVGLVGLPNAGKSTLLARLSAAKPKIADYPFTTLAPHLGLVKGDDFERFIMADIPGLIEGAHAGKGLGLQFLNHILRTRILIILLDSQSDSPEKDYSILLQEMSQFSNDLIQKPRIIALTKIDTLEQQERELKILNASFDNLPVCAISAISGEGLPELLRQIVSTLKNNNSHR